MTGPVAGLNLADLDVGVIKVEPPAGAPRPFVGEGRTPSVTH